MVDLVLKTIELGVDDGELGVGSLQEGTASASAPAAKKKPTHLLEIPILTLDHLQLGRINLVRLPELRDRLVRPRNLLLQIGRAHV